MTLDSWCSAAPGRAAELAAACDVSPAAVGKWRAGTGRPTSPSVRALVEALTGGIVKAAGWTTRAEVTKAKRADAKVVAAKKARGK